LAIKFSAAYSTYPNRETTRLNFLTPKKTNEITVCNGLVVNNSFFELYAVYKGYKHTGRDNFAG